MSRYFLSLAYFGKPFSGWQRQPNAPSIQGTLELALSTILRHPLEITGCGRTDTGVHARRYFAHFDGPDELPPTLLQGLNSLLPAGISVYGIREMHPGAHARFDATERRYAYGIALRKDPFLTDTAWFFPQAGRLDRHGLHAVADLLPRHQAFFPFCKTDSGLEHYRCTLREAYREEKEHMLVFHIVSNRFLRGMVRLIVGACVQVAAGQLALADIQTALEDQTPLQKSLSAPPQGLFLTDIQYPYPTP
jgi:tRNA pseudouridine38-40 synthase